MTYIKYSGTNEAKAQIAAPLSASSTSIVLKTGFGALFPTTFPFQIKIESYSAGVVIKREIATCMGRSGDILTVVRNSENCPDSDSASTQTTTPLEFSVDDWVFCIFSASVFDDVQDQITEIIDTSLPSKLNTSTYNADRAASMDVFAASSAGDDDYEITSSIVTAYNNGQVFKIQADVANTGASTLKLNALAAKSIKKLGTGSFVDLETGDIIVNQIFYCTYNAALDIFQFSVDPATAVVPIIESTQSVFIAGEAITAWDAIYVSISDWKAYKTNASNSAKIWFVWFAAISSSIWWSVKISTQWISKLLSWLEIWEDYFLWNETSQNDIIQSVWSGGDSNWNAIGFAASYYEVWQSFLVSWNWTLKNITLWLKKVWSPVFILNVEIFSDASFTTLVATSTNVINSSILTTSYTDNVFSFNDIFLASWTYYLKLNIISWTISTTNYVYIQYSASDLYAWWQVYDITSTNWVSAVSTWDLYMTIDFSINSSWSISKIPGLNNVFVWKATSSTSIRISNLYDTNNSVKTTSNLPVALDSSSVVNNTTNYVVAKTYTVKKRWFYLIKFWFSIWSSQSWYATIYKNWNPYWKEVISQSATYSDILFFNKGDTIEYMIKAPSWTYPITWTNFWVYLESDWIHIF